MIFVNLKPNIYKFWWCLTLNPCPAEFCFNCIFCHSKLDLLTQFQASNDKKIFLFFLNRHLLNWVICLNEYLPQTILSILVTHCSPIFAPIPMLFFFCQKSDNPANSHSSISPNVALIGQTLPQRLANISCFSGNWSGYDKEQWPKRDLKPLCIITLSTLLRCNVSPFVSCKDRAVGYITNLPSPSKNVLYV